MLLDRAEVKSFLRLTTALVDSTIDLICQQVEDWFSEQFGIPLEISNFVESHDGGTLSLHLHRQPIVEISEVRDLVLDQIRLVTDMRVEDSRVWCSAVGVGPTVWEEGLRRWRVAYTAGYSSSTVPRGLKLGLMHMVRRAYESRGNRFVSSSGVIMNWDALMNGEVMTLLLPFSPGGLIC